MSSHKDVITAQTGCMCKADCFVGQCKGLMVLLDQMSEYLENKIVPRGNVEISIRASGPPRAIKGKDGRVLQAGYDEDGETWLEVGT